LDLRHPDLPAVRSASIHHILATSLTEWMATFEDRATKGFVRRAGWFFVVLLFFLVLVVAPYGSARLCDREAQGSSASRTS